MTELPKIVGGLLAIAALSASLFNGVDPVQCLFRGIIAYFVGLTAGSLWNLFFSKPTPVALKLETQPQFAETPGPEQEAESKQAA